MIDERLGLAAPGEDVPHRRGGGQHRARRVDGIPALLEDLRAGCRRERLPRDRDPVSRVQWRLRCLPRPRRRSHLCLGDRERQGGENKEGDRNGARRHGSNVAEGPLCHLTRVSRWAGSG